MSFYKNTVLLMVLLISEILVASAPQCLGFYTNPPAPAHSPFFKLPTVQIKMGVFVNGHGKTGVKTVVSDSKLVQDSLNALATLILKRPLKLHELDPVMNAFFKDTSGDPNYVRLAKAFRLGLGIDMGDLASKVPRTGPLLIVANHPKNGSEGIAIAAAVSMFRSDVKFAVTNLLEGFPGVEGNAVFLNPYGGSKAKSQNIRTLKEMEEHMAANKVLIVFPSGEVSSKRHLDDTIAFDAPWKEGITYLINKNPGIQIMPFYVSALASQTFYKIKLIENKKLRGALASIQHVREMAQNKGQTIDMTAGAVILGRDLLIQTDSDPQRMLGYLRALTYSMKSRFDTSLFPTDGTLPELDGLSDISKSIVVRYFQNHSEDNRWIGVRIPTLIDAEIDVLVSEVRNLDELKSVISYIENRPIPELQP